MLAEEVNKRKEMSEVEGIKSDAFCGENVIN